MISGKVEEVSQEGEGWLLQTPSVGAGESQKFAPDAEHAPIKPKSSIAFPIWFGVIFIVLTALWLQTRSGEGTSNFLIEGDASTEGATVTIDRQNVGTMTQQNQPGVKVIGIRLNIQDGRHLIEVTKPGYKPFSTMFDLKGEDYLGVELQKQ